MKKSLFSLLTVLALTSTAVSYADEAQINQEETLVDCGCKKKDKEQREEEMTLVDCGCKKKDKEKKDKEIACADCGSSRD